MTRTLGRTAVGHGPRRVIVLHDWMGDHRNYDPIHAYLDQSLFSWVFADLRGYGRSRGYGGRYDLVEASADVLTLADALEWSSFHLVGHSMSTLIAQQVAADAPDRVQSLSLIAPIAPSGMGTPEHLAKFLELLGGDEAERGPALEPQWGDRLSPRWAEFKLERWAESSLPAASKGYARMFATERVKGSTRPDLPVLALIGEHDTEPFTEATVRGTFLQAYQRVELRILRNAGHYPMQETPVALASAIDRFLRSL